MREESCENAGRKVAKHEGFVKVGKEIREPDEANVGMRGVELRARREGRKRLVGGGRRSGDEKVMLESFGLNSRMLEGL